MSTHPEISHMDTETRIRAIAYTIWEEEGRPDGRAEDHWFRACELVASEALPSNSAASETSAREREADARQAETDRAEHAARRVTRRAA